MEPARAQLEELDRIEQALVARIRRSAQWLPPQYRIEQPQEARKLSDRECALQRWEAAKLVQRYEDIRLSFKEWNATEPGSDFDGELSQCLSLSDTKAAPDLAQLYAQHRSARGRTRFVSDATEHCIAEIDANYPPEERFGQILRLEPFYAAVMAADEVPIKPRDYREYLADFEQYAEFGNSALVNYLVAFYNRAFAVGPGSEALDLPGVREVLEHANADPLFCRECNRKFANDAVFKAHLSGRKHKRAAQASNKSGPVSDPELIRVLSHVLRDAFTSTIADIDRKARMTVQERVLEVEAAEREREREDAFMSGEENDNDEKTELEPQRQLLGPEGTPIPRWLYKLHGLSTTFKCEICQPHVKIAGRAQFERHFRDPKHLLSLKTLRIVPSEAYKGITTPLEALDLQASLQKRQRSGDEKEVEDDEGNVMSEKMMNDLRKQGLI